jgi:hypothetical protein
MAEDIDGNIKKITEDDKGIFSIALENDLFTGTDLGYTNALRLSYTSSEKNMPSFVIPFPKNKYTLNFIFIIFNFWL